MNDAERREYLQAVANLQRLCSWLEEHGVGSDVALRATSAEHEARLNVHEARMDAWEQQRG